MKTNEVLQIGGGNIGRALIGPLMYEAGYEVVFADVNNDLIDGLNGQKGYTLRTVSLDGVKESCIDGIRAISALDTKQMIEHIVSADLITTAVGAGVLPHIAEVIAKGLSERLQKRPQDKAHVVVVACENIERNTHTLRDHILTHLTDDDERNRLLERVSFPNCVVDRIVPGGVVDSDDPFAVTTEDYFQFAVDGNELLGDMPPVPGVQVVDGLEAVLAQKFFTLNGAHAAAAYFGYKKGCSTIAEALGDKNIGSLIRGFMDEVGEVVLSLYPGITKEGQYAFSEKTLRRFMNPYLKDSPSRVGREPLRKLAGSDRLIKPALNMTEHGKVPFYIGAAVVAGFCFDNPLDSQSQELQGMIRRHGIEQTIARTTGLSVNNPLVAQTASGYYMSQL